MSSLNNVLICACYVEIVVILIFFIWGYCKYNSIIKDKESDSKLHKTKNYKVLMIRFIFVMLVIQLISLIIPTLQFSKRDQFAKDMLNPLNCDESVSYTSSYQWIGATNNYLYITTEFLYACLFFIKICEWRTVISLADENTSIKLDDLNNVSEFDLNKKTNYACAIFLFVYWLVFWIIIPIFVPDQKWELYIEAVFMISFVIYVFYSFW